MPDDQPDQLQPCPPDCRISYPHAHVVDDDGQPYVEDLDD